MCLSPPQHTSRYGPGMDTAKPLTIGWIGTGVMGASMAGHLLSAGHAIRAHTRTRSKAEALLSAGATWADSPRAAAEGADLVCSIVGFPSDVRVVFLGSDGVFSAQDKPRHVIDFTTSSPALAEEIARVATLPRHRRPRRAGQRR